MHIFKIKTKITDLSLGKVRPEVGKLRPAPISCAGRENLKQIIKKIINFCLSSTKFEIFFLTIINFKIRKSGQIPNEDLDHYFLGQKLKNPRQMQYKSKTIFGYKNQDYRDKFEMKTLFLEITVGRLSNKINFSMRPSS